MISLELVTYKHLQGCTAPQLQVIALELVQLRQKGATGVSGGGTHGTADLSRCSVPPPPARVPRKRWMQAEGP